MEPDLEAAADAPHATLAMRMSSQRDNTSADIQLEAVTSSDALQSEGIRRRNTDHTVDMVRDTTVSSIDTDKTLGGDLNIGQWNVKAYVIAWWSKRVKDITNRWPGSSPPIPSNDGRSEAAKEKITHDQLFEKLKRDYIWEDFKTGITKLARWQLTDKDFMIIRRFEEAHMRIIIHLEIEIEAITRELRKRDDIDAAVEKSPEWYRLRGFLPRKEGKDVVYPNGESRCYEWHNDALVAKLTVKIEQYDRMVLSFAQLLALPRPPEHSQPSMLNETINEKPLTEDAMMFIVHHKDFSSFDNRDKENPFKGLIDSHLFRRPGSPLKPFLKTNSDVNISYYDERLKSILAHTLSLGILTGMLFTPISLLFLLELSRGLMAVVVFVFTILTYITIAVGTAASQFEAFVATVAYCAFLVQFLGNLGREN
ncbi:hypothetical protein MFRU_004g03260 [Monilinia fructicola]|nr:hypothetical protein MFRU_004g03260 [Monilinia fructicola]